MAEEQHQQHHAERHPEKRRIRPLYILAPVIAVIAIIAVIYVATNVSNAQTVAVGDTISVYYTGTLTNGTVFDSNVGKQPLNFTVGSGQLILGFENGVIGMKLNETKTITIPADEAYGPVNQSLIVQVSRAEFGNATPTVGMRVSSSNGQQATVKAVGTNTVTLDFNPPLAGQTLIFEIKVVGIQKK
ncbi:MAG: peptidylprolyl isomerase [Candidatus Micrarchaeota archaeon]|nr:peptidylprolyl isomerase [Candidatus Micrarchaeota archaeon]